MVYRRDIDGLRAIAVLSVLAFHYFPKWLPGGFVGVDVFFVISGYLITRGLRDETLGLREFYSRRVRRLFPALLVVLAACFAMGWLVLTPDELRFLGKHLVGASLFVPNFVVLRETGYFDVAAGTKPLLHLWSLGIEEQFYLAWPVLLLAARNGRVSSRGIALGVAGASFAAYVLTIGTYPVAAFYLPMTRLWEIAIGGALVEPSGARGPRDLSAACGGALIVAALARLAAPVPLAVLGAALLVAAGPEAWLNRRLLSRSALVAIGLVSYPLYLWHWPLLGFASIVNFDVPVTPGARAALLAASFALAVATYRLVEKEARYGRTTGVLAALMAGVLGTGVLTMSRHGFVGRVPESLEVFFNRGRAFDEPARGGLCWLAAEDPPAAFADVCVDGEPRNEPLVFLWGDSHAARFYAGVRAELGGKFRIAQYTRDACPPIAQDYRNCEAGNRETLRRIRELRPAVVLLVGGWNLYGRLDGSDGLYEKMCVTIAELRKAKVPRIVVVGPPPQWTGPLPRVVLTYVKRHFSSSPPERLSYGLRAGIGGDEEKLRRAVEAAGARYFSLWRSLCDRDGCLTLVDGEPTTSDNGHLSPRAAAYAARGLETSFQ